MDSIEIMQQLFDKAQALQASYSTLPERDIRPSYFRIMANQCATSHINLTINSNFLKEGSKESYALFNEDQSRVDDYVYQLNQNAFENVMDAALFQSELILRTLNAQLTGKPIYDGSTIPQLLARLFDDTENKWAKDECKLLMLLYAFRNTIHTGGIYFKKVAGETIDYKGNTYTFAYGKPFILPHGITIKDLVLELLDAMNVLFLGPLVRTVVLLEHPNYSALGK